MERYIARCMKTLKSWNAPLENWHCVDLIDNEEPGFICELCGYESVRSIHVMEHEEYFERVYVGCICAGIMEGDILAAKERDRKMKNRAKRKRNFPNRKWHRAYNGNLYLAYQGNQVFVNRSPNGQRYNVHCNGTTVWEYKGRPLTNFLSATYAAFDLADPIEEYLL